MDTAEINTMTQHKGQQVTSHLRTLGHDKGTSTFYRYQSSALGLNVN